MSVCCIAMPASVTFPDALFRVMPSTSRQAERELADYVSFVNTNFEAPAPLSDAVVLAAQFLEVRVGQRTVTCRSPCSLLPAS